MISRTTQDSVVVSPWLTMKEICQVSTITILQWTEKGQVRKWPFNLSLLRNPSHKLWNAYICKLVSAVSNFKNEGRETFLSKWDIPLYLYSINNRHTETHTNIHACMHMCTRIHTHFHTHKYIRKLMYTYLHYKEGTHFLWLLHSYVWWRHTG